MMKLPSCKKPKSTGPHGRLQKRQWRRQRVTKEKAAVEAKWVAKEKAGAEAEEHRRAAEAEAHWITEEKVMAAARQQVVLDVEEEVVADPDGRSPLK